MTTAVAPADHTREVRAALKAREDQLLALLGGSIPLERFLTVALHAVNSNRDLLRCTPLSIVEAIREAAALRLEPTGLLGDAYIVRYGDTARLMPGYRGLLKLARRSGEVVQIDAHVVYAGDEFAIEQGSEPRIRHIPTLGDRGGYLGAYAFARMTSGELITEWMNYADIEQIRRSSRAGGDGPWVAWWAEMARKSVLRRLMKRLPLATEADEALRLEAEAEDRPPAKPSPAVVAIRERLGIDSPGDVTPPSAGGVGQPSPGDIPLDDPDLPDVPDHVGGVDNPPSPPPAPAADDDA